MSGRVLIIGLGDLGRRFAASLANDTEIRELILTGRNAVEGASFAGLMAACGAARVRFVELDARYRSLLEQVLRQEQPDVVVQCASLLSPWYLASHPSLVTSGLRSAGFAAQLSAQLPLIMNVMEAVRCVDFRGAVVNCSYPDVTHPILARAGLSPTIGTGNVSMIQARVRAVLHERSAPEKDDSPVALPLIRVLAHHAHVTSSVLSARPEDADARPRVYLSEEAQRADELAYAGVPLQSNPTLNALSAASGVPVIRALLPGSRPLRISAPGPLGLPGGYPLRIIGGQIELDLPDSLSLGEAVAFQNRSARLDGVESIGDDGTVTFTEPTQVILRRIHPQLAEPLHPSEAARRFEVLQSALRSRPEGERL